MRILLVSDIHINDYPQKNPKDKYRLYQTSIVADNIIEAGVNNGCDTIIFAGDIVEKSVIRPYIQVQVKAFLDKIMKHFNMGFIILGNHDLDAKSELGGLNDSVLSVMFPPNLYYSDQRIFTAPDGCTIAFSDWKPKFDLSWIKGKVARVCCFTLDGGTWARARYELRLLLCSVAIIVLLWTGLGPRGLEQQF